MKSGYYFVRHSGGLFVGITIYRVWVGSSLKDGAKRKLVELYCKENDLPFVKWTQEVDSLITQFKDKFEVDGCALASPYRTASISISQLYRLIIDDSFNKFEAENYSTPFEIYLNHRNDPDFVARENRKNRDTSCQPHHAVNLSLQNTLEVA